MKQSKMRPRQRRDPQPASSDQAPKRRDASRAVFVLVDVSDKGASTVTGRAIHIHQHPHSDNDSQSFSHTTAALVKSQGFLFSANRRQEEDSSPPAVDL